MIRSRKKRAWLARGGLAVALVAVLASWHAYDACYRIPIGPRLPPEPPKKDFSERVVALNNQAVEILLEDPEGALRLYDEALREDPECHFAWANKAQLLVMREDYLEAATCFERAAALRPHSAEYYVGHAFCLHRLGRTDEAHERLLFALSAYSTQIEKAPAVARPNRAFVLFLLGRDRVAERELDRLDREYADDSLSQTTTGLRQYFAETRDGDRRMMLAPG